ncbi:MAG: MucBP domain-containing protein, partial [Clostridia bacterium]|nr:MucBP domain-containing protein [Clostridia bacterium]
VIHEAKEEEGVYGGIIKAETEKIDIPGYTNATADKEEITIEADETKNVINIYYEKRTDIKYKVEYYYNGEKDESKTVKGIATYKEIIDSYEDKIIEGYVLVEEKGIPLTIVAKEEKNVIEIHYAKKAQIKVQYIEKDTDRLIEEIVEEGYVGKEYNTISKNIEGYVLVEEPEEKNITMTEDEVIVKYYYKHVTKGVIEKHIDIDTGEILFNTIHEGNEGDEYKIEPKEIEGYDVVQEKLPTNNEGTMEKDVITVSYYYKKKAVVIVTVKYIDKDTNDVLAEDIVIKGYEGKEYKTEKKEISGYEFVEIIGKREGKMTTNEEVIYYYQKEKVPGEDVNTPGGNTGENTGGNGGTNGSDGETTDTTISDGKLPSAGLSKQQITIISFVAITITTVTLAVFAIKGTIIYNKFKN